MTINNIADQINSQSRNYKIGKLQNIRKEIKGLSKISNSKIFTGQTIDDNWAFHHGGRKEIQFNIGLEKEGLRYGLAFSIEPSQSLPDVTILYPKILKFNSLVKNDPDLFLDYKMWYWRNGSRSKIQSPYQITDNLTKTGTFIFVGKIMDLNNINYDEILSTFDELLNIYREIETDHTSTKKSSTKKKTQFTFDNSTKNLPQNSNYTAIEREINVDVRHSILQEKLYNSLVSIYGNDNVSLENKIQGKRIDIVVKISDKDFIFYEIKTGSSAKSCIRQAIGQLLEYAFWNTKDFKADLKIAGEYELDIETDEYLRYLRTNFNLPLAYVRIK
ncbi:hypothetical protein [uncultured Christiangramia sp.]|uniref:hypothetical protein n=1 Tax=uncultured Christiangramia sp. TaxID=503836 RepID=UPI00261E067B|nr:hypothetical protein [uncultured Christiangramia sp.]